jgi:hypothetical protein
MKTIFLTRISAVLLLSALLASCFNNEIDLVAYGDAYILVEVNGQDTVKGLGLHAFSYSDFNTVVVNLTGNASATYTLKPYLTFTQDYNWETPLNQYAKSLPATGDYVFNATFSDGQSLVFYDKLTSDYILPPNITSCTYLKNTERLEVKWDEVAKADAYNVKLLDQSGNYLFVSQAFAGNIANYSLSTTTMGWQSTTSYPTKGQIVIVEVAAYLLAAINSNNNFQCISKSRKQIIWDS